MKAFGLSSGSAAGSASKAGAAIFYSILAVVAIGAVRRRRNAV